MLPAITSSATDSRYFDAKLWLLFMRSYATIRWFSQIFTTRQRHHKKISIDYRFVYGNTECSSASSEPAVQPVISDAKQNHIWVRQKSSQHSVRCSVSGLMSVYNFLIAFNIFLFAQIRRRLTRGSKSSRIQPARKNRNQMEMILLKQRKSRRSRPQLKQKLRALPMERACSSGWSAILRVRQLPMSSSGEFFRISF